MLSTAPRGHAFIKVRDRATKKLAGFFEAAATKIWDCYRAESKRQLGQQIRRLPEWTHQQLPECAMKANILKLGNKRKRWLQHLDFPSAHRTSNMLDRIMKAMSWSGVERTPSTRRCFMHPSRAQRLTSDPLLCSITSRHHVQPLLENMNSLPVQLPDSTGLYIIKTGYKTC